VGIWQGKGNGKSLLLNGHVDVVPAGPEQLWEFGPWSAVIQNGQMYGRGTSDMKGGVASMIYAVEAIRSIGVHLKGDLIIESVVDEEAGGNGTLSACLRGYKADAAIVPEPTQLNICPAHRGAQFFRVKVWGKGAHAGLRFEGVSALEKAQIFINAIRQLERERDRVARKNILYAQYPIASPITIGKLASGVWPAMVPEECTFEGMIDIMPGESISSIREQFKRCIEQTASKDSWLNQHPPEVEWIGVSMNGIQTDLEHPFVQLSKNVIFQILGKAPEILGFPAGSDLRLLYEASGMHGIHIGPGDLRRAHGFNEFVELSQVIDCTKILSAMIIHWCELAE
jgi:acetylornithine deacetylase